MRRLLQWIVSSGLTLVIPMAAAQTVVGTTFEYQGYLLQSGSPANGTFDFQFNLYDADTFGSTVGSTVIVGDVTVTDGLFTVPLDFGATAFNDYARWLEIGVRLGNSTGAYNTLNPRQRIRPTPYSLATRGLDVDASGNCGINEMSPLTKLHIQGTLNLGLTSSDFYSEEDALIEGAHSWLGLHSSATSLNPGSGLALAEHNTSTSANNFWWLYRDNSISGGNLHLSYGTSTSPLSSGNTEALQISPSGNAYFGGTDPFAKYFFKATSDTTSIPVTMRVYSSFVSGVAQVNHFLDFKSTQILAVNADTDTYTALDLNPVSGGVAIGRAGTRGNSTLSVSNATLAFSTAGVDICDNSDVSIEDDDAWLSLISTSAGEVGSGIELVEKDGNKWAMFRRTSSNVGDLVFTYGSNASPSENDVKMQILPDGTTKVKVLEITGADVAERFPVSSTIEPGMVVEIDPDHAGQLRLASGEYNRRVAGVVSGAGNLPAGAILGNLPGSSDSPAIALSGRVWVYCDATQQPIGPGDLLTTADTPGHAMKATDYPRAQGAIIGKAMTSLRSGRGLVLVLVSLQ